MKNLEKWNGIEYFIANTEYNLGIYCSIWIIPIRG